MKTVPLFHIGDIPRMSHTKRWNILGDLPTQSLAEHSYNVACIAAHIVQQHGLNPDQAHAVTGYALVHDFDEIFTGDIPTPTKGALGIGSTSWIIPTLGGFPAVLNETANMVIPLCSSCGYRYNMTVRQIVKIADLIEAAAYVTRYAVSRHHIKVSNGCKAAIVTKLTLQAPELLEDMLNILTDLCYGSSVTLGELVDAHQEDLAEAGSLL